MNPLTVMTLSGSLRKASLNTAMLTMAADCAPSGLRLKSPRSLGDLPLFNPDVEAHESAAVVRLWHEISTADALLIASPEYAHGVSGVMKNALDWMVATGVFMAKPVVLWNASPRASHALANLHATLAVMSARLLAEANLELLIKSPEAGTVPTNPDPAAMRQALLILRNKLLAERTSVGSDTAVTFSTAPRSFISNQTA